MDSLYGEDDYKIDYVKEPLLIENKEEFKNKVGEEQFNEALNQVKFINEQLSELDLSNATVNNDENTIKVNAEVKNTSDGPQLFAGKEGKDDIEFHLTWAEVWLSDSTSESIVKIGTSALGTALGGLTGKVADAVVGSVVGGSINEFVAGKVSKAVYFKVALVPPFHTWSIKAQ